MAVQLCERYAHGLKVSLDPRDRVILTIAREKKTLPGVAWVQCKPGRLLDVKKPHGGDGGRVVDKGWEVRPVIITVKYWTPEQEEELWRILDTVWFPPGKPAPAGVEKGTKAYVGIDHPVPARLHINSIVIQEIESPAQAPEGPGVWLVKINALQYFEPKANTERKVKGPAHTLTNKGQAAKNQLGLDPSQTEGGPTPSPTPSQGSS